MKRNTGLRILISFTLSAIALTAAAQKENLETVADFHHISAYVVAGLLIGAFVMIFTNRVNYFREREIRSHGRQLNTQLGLVLGGNNTQVFTLDTEKKLISLIAVNGEGSKGLTIMEFNQRYDNDDFRQLHKGIILPVMEGKMEQGSMKVKGAEKDDGRKMYDGGTRQACPTHTRIPVCPVHLWVSGAFSLRRRQRKHCP